MSRTEAERTRVIESGSPLANHSMNQKNINSHLNGEERLSPPKKLVRVQSRKVREAETNKRYEREKIARITERVFTRILNYDAIQEVGPLESELKYLEENGITIVVNPQT